MIKMVVDVVGIFAASLSPPVPCTQGEPAIATSVREKRRSHFSTSSKIAVPQPLFNGGPPSSLSGLDLCLNA